MTPHQLRTFLAVADARSVSDAAEHLVVSQSAVSASMAGLQRELGVRLLERDGRGVRLTAEGTVYAGYARRVLGLLDEALIAARDREHPERGEVRLAAVPTAAEQVVPTYLATFRDRFPDAHVGLEVGSRDEVFRRLLAHEVDLAVAGRPPASSSLVSRAVADNELVLVAAPRLVPGSRAGGSSLDRLGGLPWLLREPGSGTRETMVGYLAEHDLAPAHLTLGANGAVIAGAVAGLGVTLVSRSAVTRELAAGQLTLLRAPGTPLNRPWHVVTRAEVPAPAGLFLAHLMGAAGPSGAPRFLRHRAVRGSGRERSRLGRSPIA